jgi:voltage-gated potassium channel
MISITDRRLRPAGGWQRRLYVVIFRHDTDVGRAFDIALMVAIALSILAAMAESVDSINAEYGRLIRGAEWAFTVLFTVEYVLRLACVSRPALYATSFFGVVDLLTVLPTYLSLLFPGAQSLIVIRALRLLRVFRVLKMAPYLTEANYLRAALRRARRKITVFVTTVLLIVVIVGTIMYLVEGPENGFSSIPTSVYWAIVTLTTVGYGDVAPHTTLGRTIAAALMIVGYGIIAVPTGIVTAEMMAAGRALTARPCPRCGEPTHEQSARYCKTCGERLPDA